MLYLSQVALTDDKVPFSPRAERHHFFEQREAASTLCQRELSYTALPARAVCSAEARVQMTQGVSAYVVGGAFFSETCRQGGSFGLWTSHPSGTSSVSLDIVCAFSLILPLVEMSI